jgi:AraC family transcriptional regulator
MHDSPVIDRIVEFEDVASCFSVALTQGSHAGFGHAPETPSLDSKLQHDGGRGTPTKWFDVSRWTCDSPKAWNTHVQQPEILVALCLRQSTLTLSASGSPFHDGVIDRGAILVIPPGIELNGTFHTPADFLHVHVPSRWLTEWLDDEDVSTPSSLLAASPLPLHVRDSVVIKLTNTLLRAPHGRASTSSMYADGIVLSMLARLLEIIVARASAKPARVPSVSPLEVWRVKIAVEFIDQRIDRSLSLAELGAAVGLSPMHFAARFRAATGISPHTFILRRRIEHAQTLLATTRSTVADIAFSVGFRTQAHFTTVFRHHVDDTPHRWRAKHGALQMTTARALRR